MPGDLHVRAHHLGISTCAHSNVFAHAERPVRRKEDILSEINAVTSLLRAQHDDKGRRGQSSVQQGRGTNCVPMNITRHNSELAPGALVLVSHCVIALMSHLAIQIHG